MGLFWHALAAILWLVLVAAGVHELRSPNSRGWKLFNVILVLFVELPLLLYHLWHVVKSLA